MTQLENEKFENGVVVVHKNDESIIGSVIDVNGIYAVSCRLANGKQVTIPPVSAEELAEHFRLATAEEAQRYVRGGI